MPEGSTVDNAVTEGLLDHYFADRPKDVNDRIERLANALSERRSFRIDPRALRSLASRIYLATDHSPTAPPRRPAVISIIVPVYNAQDYIIDCISSLISQTFTAIEIIFVDDCGADSSFDVIVDYALLDERIKIVRNPRNMGLLRTRQSGVRFATGDYVIHVDADDWISSDICSQIFEQIRSGEPDVIQYRMELYKDDEFAPHPASRPPVKALNNEEIIASFLRGNINFSVCNKAYKIDLWRKAQQFFPKYSTRVEDLSQNLHLLRLAKTYRSINDVGYFYRITPGSDSRENSVAALCQRGYAVALHFARFKRVLRGEELFLRIWGVLGVLEAKAYRDYVRKVVAASRNAEDSDDRELAFKTLRKIVRLNGFLPLNPYFWEKQDEKFALLQAAYNVDEDSLDEPLVSIVIPSFNMEELIDKCLASIASQTYKNLEIIVVNDCSTDQTPMIAQRWAKQDQRIRVLHHDENKGLLQTRLTGVRQARGAFIGHVDSDDTIAPTMIAEMVGAAQSDDLDVVQCGYVEIRPEEARDVLSKEFPVFVERRIFTRYLELNNISNSMWNKLIRRELWIDALRLMPDITYKAEDVVQHTVLLALAGRFGHVPKPHYQYLIRPGSGDRNRAPHHVCGRAIAAIYNMQQIRYVAAHCGDAAQVDLSVHSRYCGYFADMTRPFARLLNAGDQLAIETLPKLLAMADMPTSKFLIGLIKIVDGPYKVRPVDRNREILQIRDLINETIGAGMKIDHESLAKTPAVVEEKINVAIKSATYDALEEQFQIADTFFPERHFRRKFTIAATTSAIAECDDEMLLVLMVLVDKADLTPRDFVHFGNISNNAENWERASMFFKKAMDLGDDSLKTKRAYARTLDRTERADLAAPIAVELVEAEPENLDYITFAMWVHHHADDRRNALRYARKLIALKPDSKVASQFLSRFEVV